MGPHIISVMNKSKVISWWFSQYELSITVAIYFPKYIRNYWMVECTVYIISAEKLPRWYTGYGQLHAVCGGSYGSHLKLIFPPSQNQTFKGTLPSSNQTISWLLITKICLFSNHMIARHTPLTMGVWMVLWLRIKLCSHLQAAIKASGICCRGPLPLWHIQVYIFSTGSRSPLGKLLGSEVAHMSTLFQENHFATHIPLAAGIKIWHFWASWDSYCNAKMCFFACMKVPTLECNIPRL